MLDKMWETVLDAVDRSGDGFGAVMKVVESYHDKISSFDNKGESWLESKRSSVCWMPNIFLSQKLFCLTYLTEVQKAQVLNLILSVFLLSSTEVRKSTFFS